MNRLQKAWILGASVIGLLTNGVSGQQVIFQAGDALGLSELENSAGASLPGGNQIRVGSFSLGQAGVMAIGDDLSSLDASFSLYDSGVVHGTIGGGAGAASFTATNGDLSFVGDTVYFWTFLTADNSAPSVDYSNVIEYSLFSKSSDAWTFPDPNAANVQDRTIQVFSDDADWIAHGTITGTAIQTAAVPEPTITVVVAGGVLLGFGMLRRFRWGQGSRATSD